MHSHISKAVEDCNISDDEYKLVLDEVEKYRAMKEELRRKHTAGSLIDEDKKRIDQTGVKPGTAWIQRQGGEWVSQLQQLQHALCCVDRPPLTDNRTICRPSCRPLLG